MSGTTQTIKSAKVTSEQNKTLTDFMSMHPDLVKVKHTEKFSNVIGTNLWQEITSQLNAMEGPQKVWKAWRRVSKNKILKYLETKKYNYIFR